MRKTVYIADDLWEAVHELRPGLNVSAAVQEALRATLVCRHEVTRCERCGADLDVAQMQRRYLDGFYDQVHQRLHDLAYSGGSVVGAAKVVRSSAIEWGSRSAADAGEIRLPRSRYEARRAS